MKAFKILMLSIALFQCQQPMSELPTPEVEPQQVQAEELNYDGEMVLGKKLENPYAVKNMQKALDKVKAKWDKLPLEQITANYVYIRLLPKDDAEYDKVNNDPEIDTFEYPLDFEIKKRGNTYKDKSVGDNKFTWIYCAVPLTKQFDKKIKQEVLEELYLPFGNGKEKETDFEKQNDGFLRELEEEALILTGNKKESMRGARGVQTWYASGQIKVYDDRMNYNFSTNQYNSSAPGNVPVPGCEARANRWFTTKTALTNSSGYFSINHGWGNGDEVNYSVKWDRDDFDIRSGSLGQAYYNGPKQVGSWNLVINETSSPDNYMYAHAHRAAWYYYYNNTFGLRTPPNRTTFDSFGILNPLFGQKMHIGVQNGGLLYSHYFDSYTNFLASQIRINGDLNSSNWDSRGIFVTTIHELAHASHWKLGFSNGAFLASNLNKKFAESWAQAVGWYITRIVYSPHPSPWSDADATQGKTLEQIRNGNYTEKTYTPLFIDLVDDFVQGNYPGYSCVGCPIESANGYTMPQLENYLVVEPINYDNYKNYLLSQNNYDSWANWIFVSYK